MIPKRNLGNGPAITEVGLGTWAIGGPWRFGWGNQDTAESVRTINAALEIGINWIDTAPAYGLGHAEELVGNTIGDRRKAIMIATKCGIVWDSGQKITFSMSPESIRRECENSLKRLKTDYIDFYMIHWPDQKTLVEDAWKEMLRLKNEGKVRYIGLSNFELKFIDRCDKIHHVDFLELPYSLLKRGIEENIFPWAKKRNTGILAYSPMQAGLLTGKFNRDYIRTLPEGDWRKKDSFFKDPFFSKALDFVERIKLISDGNHREIAALAIAWVLSHQEISSAIVGARNVTQAMSISQGSGWEISETNLAEIERIYQDIFNEK